MGLLDKIKKKKNTAPQGKKVTVNSEEEFMETCKGLTRDFKGTLLLSGDAEGEKYSACLLVDSGNIIASTFEYRGLIEFRDEAVEKIKSQLKGTKGRLHMFSFSEGDLEMIEESNKSAFLAEPVALSELGLKIKALLDDWAKASEGEAKPLEMPSFFKNKANFNLLELARSPDGVEKDDLADIDYKPDNLGLADIGSMMPGISDQKSEKLRRIKEERQRKIQEKLAQGKKKEATDSEKKVASGGKILTTIDKLYSLVKKYERVRIDEKLAKALGVDKSQIEEWAVILEEHDLIELRYPTIGEPEIRVKDR